MKALNLQFWKIYITYTDHVRFLGQQRFERKKRPLGATGRKFPKIHFQQKLKK